MNDTGDHAPAPSGPGLRLLYILSVAMVIVGLFNSTPGIPGYDTWIAGLTGQDGAKLRKFPFEWFYPAFFALMMLIVALKHSMWRDWKDRSPARCRLGLALDLALVVTAAGGEREDEDEAQGGEAAGEAARAIKVHGAL